MNINKQMAVWGEAALSNIDTLGYKLDEIGVENQINRHNLIAFLMASQKRLEGEFDSISARFDSNKAKLDGIAKSAEQMVVSGLNVVSFPARYAATRFKEALSN